MATPDAQVEQTTWPVRLYIGALLFAFVTLQVGTVSLAGEALNQGRSLCQLGICGVLGLRLAWAMHTREQSKTWILYVVGMFLAVPIWIAIEPLVFALGRG